MFKIRASAAGKLMINPKAKTETETLSETTKTFLEESLKEQIYGVRKEIDSKYLTKGIELEDEAIDYVTTVLDLPFTIKNTQHFEDEYFTGSPDLILPDEVIDIKCSWDCFSFPLFEKVIPTKDYFYQLQVYMHLTGLKKARVVYVLLNTPQELSYSEAHDYSNVDTKNRIKCFEVEYSLEVIEVLIERVIESRKYLSSLQ